jgi:Domain of unknown function (DUF4431)
MPRYFIRFALCTSMMLVACAASAACMNPNEEGMAEGRLTVGRFKDAADRPETAFILRLPATACLDGEDEEERVASTKTIHVYSQNDRIQKSMTKLVGKTVVVRGKPFAQHTAHHHAPIVLEVMKIDLR